jgi:very-short-patch-repair endonuclease
LIFEHAAQQPQQTLGVITFSYAQRDAIMAEWERQRRAQPQYESFFDENAAEPFFIKNLEMVQGDERDVIFFSVGYGKDEAGKVLMNFGPLNQDGGERRLNVAVTRARRNVKLISSIQPEDIDLTRTQSQGAKLLREYMFYTRDGFKSLREALPERSVAESQESNDAISNVPNRSSTALRPAQNDSAASPFEDAVYQALTEKGLTLHRQVGASSYRLDLAVVDPQHAGHYLLGIECDGTVYASAPTARERDRLRQQVLEQLGWKMHRIWSHDWVNNQTAEVEKVMARLKESAAAPDAASAATIQPSAMIQPSATTGSVAVRPSREVADTSLAQPATAEAFLVPTETPEEIKSLPTYVWPYLYAKLPPHTEPLSQALDAEGEAVDDYGDRHRTARWAYRTAWGLPVADRFGDAHRACAQGG